MTIDQSMTHTITQVVIEAVKAAIMSVRKEKGPAERRRPALVASKASGPALRQPTFGWIAQDKYNKLTNFTIEVRIIFIVKSYKIEIYNKSARL